MLFRRWRTSLSQSTGEQTRSFQYVSDLEAGLVALMKSDYTQPVNIGNPEERSINTFASLIRDLVPGSCSRIVHCTSPPWRMTRSGGGPTSARRGGSWAGRPPSP